MLPLLLYFCIFLVNNQEEVESTSPSILSSFPPDGLNATNESCNSLDNTFQGCSQDCTGLKLCIENQTYIVDCAVQSYGKNPHCNKTSNLCQAGPASCEEGAFVCPSTDGFYPDAFDCRKFYQCYFGIPYEWNCGYSVFNPKVPECANEVACYSFSSLNGLCRGKVGQIVLHPLDPNVYINCEDYPVVMRCPDGYIFDLYSQSCHYDCTQFTDSYEWYYMCQRSRVDVGANVCPDGWVFNYYANWCFQIGA